MAVRGGVHLALALLCLLGCTHSDPQPRPLGLGPLAQREHADRERVIDAGAPRTQTSSARAAVAGDAAPREPPAPHAAAGPRPTEVPPAPDAGTLADAGTVAIESWVGLYRGRDTTKTVFYPMPPHEAPDPNAQTKVEVEGQSVLRFVLIDSSTGDDICTLRATPRGAEATGFEEQSCFVSEDSGQSALVRSGSAKLSNTELTLDLFLDAEIQSDEETMRGTIEYHFVGKP